MVSHSDGQASALSTHPCYVCGKPYELCFANGIEYVIGISTLFGILQEDISSIYGCLDCLSYRSFDQNDESVCRFEDREGDVRSSNPRSHQDVMCYVMKLRLLA